MSDRVAHLNGALAGRYRVERELGEGGMATVYLAEDLRHRRKVALKVLKPEIAAAVGSERFLAEIETTARLQHPHILPLFDSGEAGGVLYYVMPYIEGETLRERLDREGELPIAEVTHILRELVDALTEAHAKGVLHRDIKPANILLRGRHALVTDFGVAKAVSDATGRSDLTTAGVSIGTPAYMAPEQAAADANLDHRVDLYAVGVVAYELLAGRRPFEGLTPRQRLTAQVTEAPRSVTEHRASTPPVLAAAVMRCLEARPADRWQTAEALLREIEAAMTPPAGVGASLGGPAPASPALALPDKPSIAVLPFDNLSGGPEHDLFADGMVEVITATLSRIRSFFVISRNSAFRYKGQAVELGRVGRELGVRYVLQGSVQKAGGRVRITVQLIDVTSGAHVWADRLDGTLDDVFDLQDRITEKVAGALQPSIRLAEIERARRKRPQDMGAYDYTMRAMPLVWVLEKPARDEALELLARALAAEPDYPLALSLAAWCHAQGSVYNWTEDGEAALAIAVRLAEKAAELGSEDPLILAVLGAVHCFARNNGTARVMLERAVTLDPNAAWAWGRLGWVENYSDRPERAVPHFERALRLSPLDPINFNNYVGIGAANEISGRYDDAAASYRRALQERPHAQWIRRNIVSSLAGAGRIDEAAAELQRLIAVYPDLTVTTYKTAMVFSAATLERMGENLRKAGLPE
jgi:serine/threonine protein kinase/tetratricopeptide (TPR) repeat protein